jgi:hypothetical protein
MTDRPITWDNILGFVTALKLEDPDALSQLRAMISDIDFIDTLGLSLSDSPAVRYSLVEAVPAAVVTELQSEKVNFENFHDFRFWLRHLADHIAMQKLKAINVQAQVKGVFDQLSFKKAMTAIEPAIFLSFSSELSQRQIVGTLEAVADYYRACGGAGLQVDLDRIEVLQPEPAVV